MASDIRWQQRFENFDRALVLLREPYQCNVALLPALERDGTIRRFRTAVELAWKTLKDYLEHEGHTFETVTPKSVIKEAFQARIVSDGQVWIDMISHRNLLSHTYDGAVFEQAVIAVRDRYLGALEALHGWLLERRGPQ